MSTIQLKEHQWNKIVEILEACRNGHVGKPEQCRRFMEGMLWLMGSGVQWRFLPEKYEKRNSVYKRFARWCDNQVWPHLQQHFAADPDMEQLIIDSTMVRAHPCAAGVAKEQGSQAEQALGRSRGGFSRKIHISVDGLGNPLRFILTAGQRNDIIKADAFVLDFNFEPLIADKGYDADDFIHLIIEQYEAEVVIPPRAKRTDPRDYDEHYHTEQHLVECFINKIKWYRRIFARFEKFASRYLGFLGFAGALFWLCSNVN